MNTTRKKKVFNLVQPFLKNNEYTNLNLNFKINKGFQGPICDSEGFRQHKGECWNDTLQEIFLFTDGLKEITQPLMYNLDTSYNNLYKLISTRLFPGNNELKTEEVNTVNKLIKYITLMKVRFVSHYNFLIANKNSNKLPLIEKIYNSKRRYSTICAVGSAKHIINLYYGNSNIYTPGLSHTLRNELLLNLIRIFDIGYNVTSYRGTENLSNINAIFISANSMKYDIDNKYINKGPHAFGLLKCDSIWKLYDDNRPGLINIDEKVIVLYIKENNVAIGVDDKDEVFILKYENNEIKNNEIKNNEKIIYITKYYDIKDNVWKEWSSELNKLHNFNIIYSKFMVSIIRPRIRWTNMKKGNTRGGKITKKVKK